VLCFTHRIKCVVNYLIYFLFISVFVNMDFVTNRKLVSHCGIRLEVDSPVVNKVGGNIAYTKILIKFRSEFTHFCTLKAINTLFMDILITNNQKLDNLKYFCSSMLKLFLIISLGGFAYLFQLSIA
jgi:hypothetical protein